MSSGRLGAGALLLALAATAACDERAATERGRELFSDPALSDAQSNTFACSTCHEAGAGPSVARPGYALGGAADRPTFWGGAELDLLDASNQCVTQFMKGRALAPEDERGRALHAYLRSLAGPSQALPLTVVRDIVDVPSGDAAAGEALYPKACGVCHGVVSTGEGRITRLAAVLPDDVVTAFGVDPGTGARAVTIEKARHGKFYGIGGVMPLFSLEALSDTELGAILAYLERFGLPSSP